MRRPKLALPLLVLLVVVFGGWSLTFSNRNKPGIGQDQMQRIPIVVRQLPAENGAIPVEVKCGEALLSAPNRLESFSCRLKNNTVKRVRAGNVAYSVVFESGGQEGADTRFHTFDTFIHPDLYEPSKAIPPEGEHVVEPPGPIFFGLSVIRAIKIEIDYLEFEDGTELGTTKKGSELIADIRVGAAKYLGWLLRKYAENGRSPELTGNLLQQDLPIQELHLNTSYQEQGARTYRIRLRRIDETLGGGEVDKFLKRKIATRADSKPR